jgi:hypothetical protein
VEGSFDVWRESQWSLKPAIASARLAAGLDISKRRRWPYTPSHRISPDRNARFEILAKLTATGHLLAGGGVFEDFADHPCDAGWVRVMTASPVICHVAVISAPYG